MSQDITATATPIVPSSPQTNLQQADAGNNYSAPQTFSAPESGVSKTEIALRTTLQKLSAGREYRDEKTFKDFTKLATTLEQVFGQARDVEREEGETELKQGGLRRIDTDLRKLFKGLGMPPQLAKSFSRGISDAMSAKNAEQISFSLTSSRSFDLSLQQEQLGYLATGDGSGVVAAVSSSFQLTAVQTHSVDVAINLRTGEFSLSRSSTESLTIGQTNSTALASFAPAAEQAELATAEEKTVEADATPAVEQPEADAAQNDINALVASNSTLLHISRTVQQAAIMQLTPVSRGETEEADEELFSDAVNSLQQLVDKLSELKETAENMFDSLTEISNLRVERNPEDDDDYLSFTVAAQAPIGLTATDAEGRSSTIYPRPDGSIGKIAEAEVDLIA